MAVHIPVIAARLNLDPAILGLALLNVGLGGVISQPLTGWMIARTSSRPAAMALLPVFLVTFIAPIVAWSTVIFLRRHSFSVWPRGPAYGDWHGGSSSVVTATATLLGFLIGPPVIGFIAHAMGLTAALGFLTLAGLVIAIGAALYEWPPRA